MAGEKKDEYTLYYFPIRGRNWLILITASVAGIPVTWERVTGGDWKSFAPWGQLPVLKRKFAASGKVEYLAQSLAIVRYLAKIGGIMGDNAWEEARNDELIHAWEDIHQAVFTANSQPNRKQAMDSFFNEKLPPKLKQLEGKLQGETFFPDGKIRVGDLAVYAGLNIIHPIQNDILNGTPKLRVFYDKVGADPRVKAVTSLEGVGNFLKRE
eukprot:TRINITY_DN980_c0_g1_i1.p1 TRINITY_DN980_c0_g1~~TRINITY_DN980_c0_g1_i1.p1  ORF type:complete len:232 (+),score=59.38 TRINITY_DN980_c0_g1_i1:65-697(+)